MKTKVIAEKIKLRDRIFSARMLEGKSYKTLVQLALAEDKVDQDYSAQAVFPDFHMSTAKIFAKQDGVICGLDVAAYVFKKISPDTRIQKLLDDGDYVRNGQSVMLVSGYTSRLLSAERTALNFLGHMSGIASIAYRYTFAIKGTGVVIVDTRKTLPGYRMLDKYAVTMGGARNHRYSLADAIMLKDNHIAAAGSISKAIEAAIEYRSKVRFIEIEVKNLNELSEVLTNHKTQVDVIMLDNMSVRDMYCAVLMSRQHNYPGLIEASGNITLDNLNDKAASGVNVISTGAITHSAPNFDLSMLIDSDTLQ